MPLDEQKGKYLLIMKQIIRLKTIRFPSNGINQSLTGDAGKLLNLVDHTNVILGSVR